MRRAIQIGVGLFVLVAIGLISFLLLGGSGEGKRYNISSEAMEPTFSVNEEVHADTGAYGSADPELGDVVVFNPPRGAIDHTCEVPRKATAPCAEGSDVRTGIVLIKRVVAGPGDTLALKDGRTVLNGVEAEESFIAPCAPDAEGCDLPEAVTVPDGEYYLLGDNRGSSDDSRFWGPVPAGWIFGRVDEG